MPWSHIAARPARGAFSLLCSVFTAFLFAPGSLSGQSPLEIVVDLSERTLEVRLNGEVLDRYDVAVGRRGFRTPRGTYRLSRVVWNPGWNPPPRKWARDRKPAAPNARDNPMGDVKIFFSDMLYIHGTEDTRSLGTPASHGCVRMRNEDVARIARLVMEHGGAGRSDDWYAEAARNDASEHPVTIPQPPILRVQA
jgi:lipoprotein-anchoring transpeptidase ErfK/SrfK